MTRQPKETKAPAPAAGAHAAGTFAALAHRATFSFAGDDTNRAGRYLKVASTHATHLTTQRLCRFAPDDRVDDGVQAPTPQLTPARAKPPKG